MAINWAPPPPYDEVQIRVRDSYVKTNLLAKLKNTYTVDELKKLCVEVDAVKNFLEMLDQTTDQ